MIECSALVGDYNPTSFSEKLAKAIGEMQEKGLIVEVKYCTQVLNCDIVYSALLLGRKKGE